VHPTQLYETFALVIVAVVLVRLRRAAVSDRVVLALYFILAGASRFAIEFVRVNRVILGPFTLAQMLAAALVLVGAALLALGPRLRLRPNANA
jgi:phosphatidylglycerol:prolipoprotein diacylglycerol transferase